MSEMLRSARRALPAALLATALAAASVAAQSAAPVLVVHGGAGTILRENMTPDLEEAYRAGLREALAAGWTVLEAGGPALDAVEAAIRTMEDSPLFNAGKGAVFTSDGRNELDASIMDGTTRSAGAVAAVRHVRNPISLARRVMEASPHVLLAGEGAEEFALEQGIDLVPAGYFFTERRWRSLERARERTSSGTSRAPSAGALGTVGAVALDRDGHLAAGTSTGGMTNKRWGRIGDSPIVGAGTWADDGTCAVSGTGHGEFFIRNAVAHDVCARVRHGASLEEAARAVVLEILVEDGADGGIIALDPAGRFVMVMNTPGMYRGYRTADEGPVVAIYADEE